MRLALVSFTLITVLNVFGQQPDPMKHCASALNRSVIRNFDGEGSCWHAAYYAEDFLDGYEAYGNEQWLAAAQKYYDGLLAKLRKDPDGYEGWIGRSIYNVPGIQTDALVGDAILLAPMVRFAEIVRHDAKLKPKFGAAAGRYVKMARRIMWEKWNHRGCYYEDDMGFGSYHAHDKGISTKTGKWVDRSSSVISDNLNKHYAAGIVLLRLWRLDPRDEYKKRIVAIFSRAKHMWRYFRDEDRIVWNFWMPHGPYDIDGKAPKSWVAVHPSRSGYQAGEVADWVEVYDSGLVFDKADLERIIRTNHWMADNGKKKSKDGFTSADGSSAAGCLWSALARFDERIRNAQNKRLQNARNTKQRIDRAYLQNVVMKQLGWQRRLMRSDQKPEVSRVPLQDGKFLSMTVAIPTSVETINNSRIKLATQTKAAGTLKIELLAKDGETVLGMIYRAKVGAKAEYSAPRWDGTNPKTGKKDLGEYCIRWTLNNESRMSRVWVKVGVKRKRVGAEPIAKGTTIKEDFEGKLNPRWKIEGATVSTEKGSKSLKLTTGQSAMLVFGDDESLPVRIRLRVHDSGAKQGRRTNNGAYWGVRMGEGSRFVIRQVWRKYLNGDKDYSWLNTGENQFFTPHPAKVGRKSGWTVWVFDLTNPNSPVVTAGGKKVGTLSGKFQPDGAVAICLQGGSSQSGPIYVDDIVVEYP